MSAFKDPELTSLHRVFGSSSAVMETVPDRSVHLVVTSPPYPMVEMWDQVFGDQNAEITGCLEDNDGKKAFELMHHELGRTWQEVERVLVPGGIACINIGDATRTIGGEFQLYSNHSRIIQLFLQSGFINLPNILWRKPTNAPNKFMGSGMLPPGAYVTLEHEWILIFRKGGKRTFSAAEKQTRGQSAIFWEERNQWFSDLWELKGTRQQLSMASGRERSGAYPFEIPFRLIQMYSLYGEMVLDPFVGTGTTTLAAITSGRNSIGFEIDPLLSAQFLQVMQGIQPDQLKKPVLERLEKHRQFIRDRRQRETNGELRHFNENLNLPVMTRQEKDLMLYNPQNITIEPNDLVRVEYTSMEEPPAQVSRNNLL